MPFWLRRKSPTSNKIELKIQNQRLRKYQEVINQNSSKERIKEYISKAPLTKQDYGLHHSRSIELKSESSRKQEQMAGGKGKNQGRPALHSHGKDDWRVLRQDHVSGTR